jgi:hypothetical protein
VIIAIKSYPMSPFIETKHMDKVLEDLFKAKAHVDREGKYTTC